jgi:multiple sugar transport system substrate-binding protein
MRKFTLPFVALAALVAAVPALAQDAKPLAGQSITVLMPSPQAPNIPGDFEAETGIHVNMQTLSWTISAPSSSPR